MNDNALIDHLGMPVGWAAIVVGNFLGAVVSNGMTILGCVSILFGMFCQGYTVYLRHQDHRERRSNRGKQ
jgi:hypothetical protein